jgi:hypothetical protein
MRINFNNRTKELLDTRIVPRAICNYVVIDTQNYLKKPYTNYANIYFYSDTKFSSMLLYEILREL